MIPILYHIWSTYRSSGVYIPQSYCVLFFVAFIICIMHCGVRKDQLQNEIRLLHVEFLTILIQYVHEINCNALSSFLLNKSDGDKEHAVFILILKYNLQTKGEKSQCSLKLPKLPTQRLLLVIRKRKIKERGKCECDQKKPVKKKESSTLSLVHSFPHRTHFFSFPQLTSAQRGLCVGLDCLQPAYPLRVLIHSEPVITIGKNAFSQKGNILRREKTDCGPFCSKQTLRQHGNGVADWTIHYCWQTNDRSLAIFLYVWL